MSLHIANYYFLSKCDSDMYFFSSPCSESIISEILQTSLKIFDILTHIFPQLSTLLDLSLL